MRGRRNWSSLGQMDKSLVKFAREGDPSLLVWKVHPSLMGGQPSDVQIYALLLMSRPGGFLVAIPEKVLSSDLLLDNDQE